MISNNIYAMLGDLDITSWHNKGGFVLSKLGSRKDILRPNTDITICLLPFAQTLLRPLLTRQNYTGEVKMKEYIREILEAKADYQAGKMNQQAYVDLIWKVREAYGIRNIA